ncbi:MAG: aspartate--tRNA ligase [Spirochaetaceae bacterium]|jgi:aspartyl-tRNA synthetase|nr:aspartate--tRNA ligase [Spirochaetaceae bacterium]
MKRTVTCGSLRKADVGKTVILNGWVNRKRDHGGISFINLRDRYGITQAVVDTSVSMEALAEASAGAGAYADPAAPPSAAALAALTAELRNEYCVAMEGVVRPRPPSMVNPDMATGEIEVLARRLMILSRSEPLPFQIDEDSGAREELRLRYRYLDLRSTAMQRRIRLRSEVAFAVREWMTGQGFYEIETPTFIRSTPEGARDYLVPSRLYPGKFYALPQSPQLYKQLLMVSGFDRYFQIARCYRDEDARGDRQPEFTQIDIEMSFVSRDDILAMTEGLMGYVFKKNLGLELPACFTRLSFEEAMERYGTDKPDLRFDLPLQDFAPYAEAGHFQAFKDVLAAGEAERQAAAAGGIGAKGGGVKALVLPAEVMGKTPYSRKQIEELEVQAKIHKARGLAWMKVASSPSAPAEGDGGLPILEGGVAKFFGDTAGDPPSGDLARRILGGLGAGPGDLILIVADSKRRIANTALGAVRSKLGRDLGLAENGPSGEPGTGQGRFAFVWIVDFPLFEFNEEENRWEAAHHLFSYPQEQYHAVLESDPGAVKGDLYDLVLNGYELASGSIRIHDPDLQKRVFSVVGIDPAEAEKKFGFLTGAFKFGAPPHGGIAPGLDRLVMLMAGETSIKEVIAFPKNSFAESPMDGCPNEVEQKQLDELHIIIKRGSASESETQGNQNNRNTDGRPHGL